ncbi:MAG: type II toxin-antitoxin system HicA family toxin [Acidobacteriia bacterium]|nr:type II toxin-antitoxin system HicA family toxin [Terriglobia bacterium]
MMYIYMHMETVTSRIRRRLIRDGWYLSRHGMNHDIYRHPTIRGIITLPRHQRVSAGVAASIAKKAGWS